jgi:hypothetical protein
MAMRRAVLKSLVLLVYFELIMRFSTFKILYENVRKHPVRPSRTPEQTSAEQLSRAVDLACVFYFKQVRCLQRSAVTAVLLRNYGWQAEMVIGVQILPPKFHAWVALDQRVVNDKPYMLDIYTVIERC